MAHDRPVLQTIDCVVLASAVTCGAVKYEAFGGFHRAQMQLSQGVCYRLKSKATRQYSESLWSYRICGYKISA